MCANTDLDSVKQKQNKNTTILNSFSEINERTKKKNDGPIHDGVERSSMWLAQQFN